MGRACSIHWGEKKGFGGRMIIRWILEKYDRVVWT
jgi:hypothetical protein